MPSPLSDLTPVLRAFSPGHQGIFTPHSCALIIMPLSQIKIFLLIQVPQHTEQGSSVASLETWSFVTWWSFTSISVHAGTHSIILWTEEQVEQETSWRGSKGHGTYTCPPLSTCVPIILPQMLPTRSLRAFQTFPTVHLTVWGMSDSQWLPKVRCFPKPSVRFKTFL